MRRKRAVTLIEMLIVIFLIGIIGSVIGYNMMGSMEKGRRFKTEQGIRRLEEIVNLQISMGSNLIDIKNANKVEERREKVRQVLLASGLVKENAVEDLIKDGWGAYYHISVDSDGAISFNSSKLDDIKNKEAKAAGG